MISLTKAQNKELKVWEFFIPKNCEWAEKTDEDIKKFFEWSEQGKHKEDVNIHTYKLEGRTYFHALVWGKRWASIHIHEIWEKSIGEGIGYVELLKDMPREVVDFIKKEMFQGRSSDLIEKCYVETK